MEFYWKCDTISENNHLEDAEIYRDEISGYILDEMSDTFNCDLEDGSDQEVAS